MNSKRVLLLGAFGQGNPGDESLCAAFVRALAGHDVMVASADPADTARRHGVEAIPAGAIPVARTLRQVDAVVVAGGTIFKRLHHSSGRRPSALLASTAALMAGAHAVGCPVALVGVGAGDLRAFCSVVEGQSRRIAQAADEIGRERMADWVETFTSALDRDLIDAGDLGRPHEPSR